MTVPVANKGVGWGPAPWISTGDNDAGLFVMTDTAVALAPARHSLRLNLPNGRPVVLPLPGKQLVKPSTSGWCSPDWGCKQAQPGQRIVGGSVTLPAGKSFHVSLQVQASPCGTIVELMHGDWIVKSSIDFEGEQDIVVSTSSSRSVTSFLMHASATC